MSSPAKGRIFTVLVVEDDAAVRTMTGRMLINAGYRVHTAADGREALALLAQSGQVDVIVTDVRMPYVNGYDLAAQLSGDYPHVPIVFMSGFDIHLGSLALPGPVLPKPFRADQLTDCVERLLRPRQSA
jgi:two-component system cell cycle sensor histidine kinase/response regulator CckA